MELEDIVAEAINYDVDIHIRTNDLEEYIETYINEEAQGLKNDLVDRLIKLMKDYHKIKHYSPEYSYDWCHCRDICGSIADIINT